MFIAKELLRLVNDEDGLTVVEYAIAGGLIASATIAAFVGLGDRVAFVMSDLCNEMNTATTNAAGGANTGTAPTSDCQ